MITGIHLKYPRKKMYGKMEDDTGTANAGYYLSRWWAHRFPLYFSKWSISVPLPHKIPHSHITRISWCILWKLVISHIMMSRVTFSPSSVSGWVLALGSQSVWDSPLSGFFSGTLPSWAAFFLGRLFPESLRSPWVIGKYSHSFVPGDSKYSIIFHVPTYSISVFSKYSPFTNFF